MTSKAVVQKLRQALRSLNAVEHDAAELREGLLEAMAKLSSSLHRMSEAAASAAIAAREKGSKQYCQLRRIFRTSENDPTSTERRMASTHRPSPSNSKLIPLIAGVVRAFSVAVSITVPPALYTFTDYCSISNY